MFRCVFSFCEFDSSKRNGADFTDGALAAAFSGFKGWGTHCRSRNREASCFSIPWGDILLASGLVLTSAHKCILRLDSRPWVANTLVQSECTDFHIRSVAQGNYVEPSPASQKLKHAKERDQGWSGCVHRLHITHWSYKIQDIAITFCCVQNLRLTRTHSTLWSLLSPPEPRQKHRHPDVQKFRLAVTTTWSWEDDQHEWHDEGHDVLSLVLQIKTWSGDHVSTAFPSEACLAEFWWTGWLLCHLLSLLEISEGRSWTSSKHYSCKCHLQFFDQAASRVWTRQASPDTDVSPVGRTVDFQQLKARELQLSAIGMNWIGTSCLRSCKLWHCPQRSGNLRNQYKLMKRWSALVGKGCSSSGETGTLPWRVWRLGEM